jgi:hypothetical protein
MSERQSSQMLYSELEDWAKQEFYLKELYRYLSISHPGKTLFFTFKQFMEIFLSSYILKQNTVVLI